MTQAAGDNGSDDRLHSQFVQNNDSVSGHPGQAGGAGSESDHDRSSDRSDDLSSRESSAEQVTIIITPNIFVTVT